jgi:hypothetical protein
MELDFQSVQVSGHKPLGARRQSPNGCAASLGAAVRLTVEYEPAAACSAVSSSECANVNGENCVSHATAAMQAKP